MEGGPGSSDEEEGAFDTARGLTENALSDEDESGPLDEETDTSAYISGAEEGDGFVGVAPLSGDEFETPREDFVSPPPPMPSQFLWIFSKARHNHTSEVKRGFEEGAPIDGCDQFGNTLLHIACQNGLKRLAKTCLRRGGNVNSQNYKGNTPLHFCFAFGYNELGDYLIAKGGADPMVKNTSGLRCHQGLGTK
mmetsp:Transcript_15078/g.32751  ORF Transcript_15078/g.32751 Transcript_15078/m.32751 type:complete len:193 (-) Transcript_15078:107-685(-)